MEMKSIIEVLVRRVSGRMFHVSATSEGLSVVSLEDNDTWVISFEGVSVTGKIYVEPVNVEIIFEVIKVEGQRIFVGEKELVGFKVTIMEAEVGSGVRIEDALIRCAGEIIFHVSAATLYVNRSEENVWTIFFEGVTVTGNTCLEDNEATFEVIKVEGQRKFIGLKYTI